MPPVGMTGRVMFSHNQRLFLARLAIGLIQGAALYLLYHAEETRIWPATQGLIFAPALLVFLFIPLLLSQALGEMAWARSALWAVAAAVVLALVAAFDNWSAWPVDWGSGFLYGGVTDQFVPHIIPSLQLFVASVLGLFIGHALVIGAAHDRRFKASYPVHFDVAWKMGVQLALIIVFVGAFWLLLFLGAGLFSLIKLAFFQKLIEHEWFSIPITALATAGALHLTDIRPALVAGARTLLLSLLAWLLPLITLITAGFVASLPFTGLSALWGFGHATALLLVATAVLIVLINAAHQDGAAERMPPALLQWSGTIAAVLILPLAAIAGYALYLRVNQYGWTPDRVTVAAIAVVALAHAAGYVRAAFARGRWLAHIEDWNFHCALLTLVLAIALFTPLLSPARISVSDQMARLARGAIAPKKFDYAFLRWDGGRYGMTALQALAARGDGYARGRARSALAEKFQTNIPVVASKGDLEAGIAVFPKGAHLPQDFLAQNWSGDFAVLGCATPSRAACLATMQDVDRDGVADILLFNGHDADIYRRKDTGWLRVGGFTVPNCVNITAALAAGRVRLEKPPLILDDVVVGGVQVPVSVSPPERGAACPRNPKRP